MALAVSYAVVCERSRAGAVDSETWAADYDFRKDGAAVLCRGSKGFTRGNEMFSGQGRQIWRGDMVL